MERIDTEERIAHTPTRSIQYRHLVSSAPLPRLIDMCQMEAQRELFTWNKVLVFNLGFDKKGPEGVHWMYFPERELSFYRVGFYDNIMGADRMSLYVEIGAAEGETLDVEGARVRVLDVLSKA